MPKRDRFAGWLEYPEHKYATLRGRRLPLVKSAINYVDLGGNEWTVWATIGITLSAWRRLEPVGNHHRRPKSVYDPGSSIVCTSDPDPSHIRHRAR